MSKNLNIRILTVLAVLATMLFFAFPVEKRINLGLDLKGGMHLILKVETETLDENARQDAVERAIEILRNRIDSLGVAEPVIQRQGEDQIIIQLPGITDRNRALDLIGKVAQLEFALVDTSLEMNKQAIEGNIPAGYRYLSVKNKNQKLLVGKTLLKGDEIANASIDYNTQAFGQPIVKLSFKAAGAKQFAEVTRAHVNQQLAIIIDGVIQSAPNINEPILSGSAVIQGSFTEEEASLLALALRSGSLPAPMHIEEDRTVGPLLGQESIQSGLYATLAGGVLLMLFVLIYYRTAGIITNLALAMNLILILGIMGSLRFLFGAPATLTLPGIAGIILTLGMAVDANVLINERIREELENGTPLNAAVSRGFNKAFSAIIDSNLTTLIAAFILFQFGSGPIKGFAVTLSIGLLASLFTALFVTRTIFLLLLELGWIKKLPMMKIFTKTNINFINKRNFCIAVSLIIIIASLTYFFKNQDKVYGIDFAGGQVQEYRFEKPVDTAVLRQHFAGAGMGDAVIQQIPEKPETVIIRTSQDKEAQTIAIFKSQMSDNPYTVLRIEKVGPVVGKELRKKAILAVIFAMGGILIYVGFRFHHFDFASAGVIALLHDVIITLGVVTWMGGQVDLLTITALLTIAGYSINDTIVIYDRVRENTNLMRRSTLKEIINTSINQTLSRTILTTLTTLIVVVCLFLKGGELLHTFSLCLLVGFVAGTYSTIFIAAPLVLAWEKKKK
ncbi:MAG TPA: protein translocase subunit SecD [Candidatus Omnitrophota bacterium]|nr:protein translocase subunit SecD [Candidatus Omnitrophota bacterium]